MLIGGGGFDEFIGEGGDDIMVGGEGEDHFDGGSGFDWGTYKFDRFGVTVDMLVSDLFEPPVAPSNAGILDRFAFTEGLSGSAFGDFLRGDDAEAADIAVAGAQGSVLTNIALINGLQDFLGAGVTSFGSGNIILGGSGSDIIEGRGGDDLIDGDQWLNVRVSVREGTNPDRAAHRCGDRQLRQHRRLGPAHAQRDLQSRPAPNRPRDPDGNGRLRHGEFLRRRR